MTRRAWLLGLSLLLSACGYREGVIQRAENSYLKFTGNWTNATVQIDDNQPFTLTPPPPEGGKAASPANTLYQVSPGRHRVMISRDGRVVVDRILMLDNRVTTEVQVP